MGTTTAPSCARVSGVGHCHTAVHTKAAERETQNLSARKESATWKSTVAIPQSQTQRSRGGGGKIQVTVSPLWRYDVISVWWCNFDVVTTTTFSTYNCACAHLERTQESSYAHFLYLSLTHTRAYFQVLCRRATSVEQNIQTDRHYVSSLS